MDEKTTSQAQQFNPFKPAFSAIAEENVARLIATETGRRLIEHHHLGTGDEGASERHAHPLAAREFLEPRGSFGHDAKGGKVTEGVARARTPDGDDVVGEAPGEPRLARHVRDVLAKFLVTHLVQRNVTEGDGATMDLVQSH